MSDLDQLKAENDRKQEELMQHLGDLGSSALAWRERAERAEAALSVAELARDGARATLDQQIRDSAALRERVSALADELERTANDCMAMEAAGEDVDGGWAAGMIRAVVTRMRALVPAPGSDPGATEEE